MTANDENWRMKAPPTLREVPPSTTAGLFGAVLARARSLVSAARPAPACCDAPSAGPVQSLDDRLLLDIGLAVDAVRREMPPVPWPH